MQQHHSQSTVIVAIIVTLSVCQHLIEASSKFERYDQPKTIDLVEEDFDPLIMENGIEIDEHDDSCPFSVAHRHSNDDWQIIELPHGEAQFDRIDHLPVVKAHIDYDWPTKRHRKNKDAPNVDQKTSGTGRWKRPIRLDARKLSLERKFNLKSKLTPPVNIFYKQTSDKPTLAVVKRPKMILGQPPIVTMFKDHKAINMFDQIDEINQQQDLLAQREKDHPPSDVVVETSPKMAAALDMIELNYGSAQLSNVSLTPISSSSARARESFQAAADLAKKLDLGRSKEPDNQTRTEDKNVGNSVELSSSLSSELNSPADGWGSDTTRADDTDGSLAPRDSLAEPSPRFLGFGQIYKTNNGRSSTQQARLSCSFGLDRAEQEQPDSANVTISNVQWSKFLGNYDSDQVEPPFECKHRTCRTIEVNNDLLTTVHPRPAIQHYSSDQAQTMPSYSLTIHQVDQARHFGVYRCSAIRQIGDRKPQLVYRVVPFA